jgi:hypothetical protein
MTERQNMSARIAFQALVMWIIAGQPVTNAAQPSLSPCGVTLPTAVDHSFGTALLSTWLWPDGTIVFKPGGPGFRTSDGALGMKFPWMRGVPGTLKVTGHRLDGVGGPIRLEANDNYGEIGFQPSYLIFTKPGCWEVSAQVGERADSRITFVTKVVQIGQGPTAVRRLH